MIACVIANGTNGADEMLFCTDAIPLNTCGQAA